MPITWVELLIYQFAAVWVPGLIALIVGPYTGKSKATFPDGFVRNCTLFLKVWGVTFFAQLAFGYLGVQMQWNEGAQSGFAEFLLPIAAGAYFARQLMVSIAKKAAVPPIPAESISPRRLDTP
jgi:hypothetical protein